MPDMRLIVVGAAGRMGRTLIRVIAETPGVTLSGAIERAGAAEIGKDSGELAGLGTNGIAIAGDPLPLFAKAEGVLDFTVPAATLAFAELAAQARIVHVIGTTGLSADDEARIRAASRHAVIVKSGNMSVGVNLLAALVRQAAEALGPAFDVEVLEMHHRGKVDAPSGTALMLGAAAAQGRGIALEDHSVRGARRHHRRAQGRRHRLRDAPRWVRHRRAQRALRRRRRDDHAFPPGERPRPLRPRRAPRGALGPRQEARPLFDDGCAWTDQPLTPSRNSAMTDRLLVLVRHGQSEWNLKNLFTGWRDVDLTPQGIKEATAAGQLIKARGLAFDVTFTSALKRAQRTLDIMLGELGQTGLPVTRDQALNERDYGDLSGLNKDDARAKWGRGAGAHLAALLQRGAARAASRSATPAPGCGPITCTPSSRMCCAASGC